MTPKASIPTARTRHDGVHGPRARSARNGRQAVLPSRRCQDGGFTVVEVTLAMVLLSVVLGAVVVTFATIHGAWLSSAERHSNLSEGQVMMDTLSKDLRTATRLDAGSSPFLVADDRDVTFYANLDTATGPKLLRAYVDGNDLMIQSTEPDAGSAPDYTYGENEPRVRFVGKDVANDAGQPLFAYHDGSGNTLATPLSGADRLGVRSVEINLYVAPAANQDVPATQLVNEVRLPNVDFTPIEQ